MDKVLYLKFIDKELSTLGIATEERCFFHDSLTLDKTQKLARGVRIIEKIGLSPLAVIVEVSSPRKLQIVNLTNGREVCYFYFPSSIIAVRLNKARLVVLLPDKIYIHEIPSLKAVHVVEKISVNPNGIIDFCENSEKSLLAYPVSDSAGLLQVFDAIKLESKYKLLCHEAPLAIVAFNVEGNLLATASEKGTLIRVWSTFRGSKLFEFRRGLLRNAAICSIAFSMDNKLLAVSSDTSTVHIFKLPEPEDAEVVEDSWFSWMKTSLPTQITAIFCEERAFASITSSFEGSEKSCLAIRTNGNQEVLVYVASYDGTLYIYSFNMQLGGDCTLIKQQRFLEEHSVMPPKLRNLNTFQPNPPSAVSLSESITAYVTDYVPTASQMSQIPGMVTNLSYNLLQSAISMFDSEQQSETRTAEENKNKSTAGISDGEPPHAFPVDLNCS